MQMKDIERLPQGRAVCWTSCRTWRSCTHLRGGEDGEDHARRGPYGDPGVQDELREAGGEGEGVVNDGVVDGGVGRKVGAGVGAEGEGKFPEDEGVDREWEGEHRLSW